MIKKKKKKNSSFTFYMKVFFLELSPNLPVSLSIYDHHFGFSEFVCVYVLEGGMHATTHVWRSENNFRWLSLRSSETGSLVFPLHEPQCHRFMSTPSPQRNSWHLRHLVGCIRLLCGFWGPTQVARLHKCSTHWANSSAVCHLSVCLFVCSLWCPLLKTSPMWLIFFLF